MPTVDEMIQHLQVVRDVLEAGDMRVAICIPGEHGIASRQLNVGGAVLQLADGELVVPILCSLEEVPLPKLDMHIHAAIADRPETAPP